MLAVNASSGTFCWGPPGVSGRRESLAPWWLVVLDYILRVDLVVSDPTQEDGEKADVLLRCIRDRLRENLLLLVAGCIGA